VTDSEIKARLYGIAQTVKQYGVANLNADEMYIIATRFDELTSKEENNVQV